MITKRQRILFICLVLVHLILVFFILRGTLNSFFNDASLRKGQGCDFFAVYQAGYNAGHGESVYLDNEGEATPYSYPFRYLPFIGYSLGILFNIFAPFTTYYIWITIYEILLAINIYLTYKLAKNTSSFLLACIPWLIFTPYLLEIYMGQWSFLLASFLFYSVYGLIKKSKLTYLFAISPLIKPNALILAPLFLRFKKFKVLISTAGIILLTSVPYFAIFREDISIFAGNFKDVLSYHGGNLGFKSLYGLTTVEYLSLPMPRLWFLGFVIALGLLTLCITFKFRNVILSYALWICYYFLIYKDVWEHHYVLLMPVFATIITTRNINPKQLISKRYIALLISFLLIALPTPFILQYFFASNAPVEPTSLSPFFAIPYHATKVIGIFLLYAFCYKAIKTERKAQ